MKIIVIGGTGTIGQAIIQELGSRHEIICAGHSSGDIQVDITDQKSIEAMYQQVENIDAVVLAAGKFHFGPFMQIKSSDYELGLQNKLMGQVNVVLAGREHINDNGSFTLVSGVVSTDPIKFASSGSMVNAAIDGFVKSAAIEMPRGIRINSVSPTVVEESMKTYAQYFRGFEPVPAARVASAFSKSVEGAQTGQVYRAGY